MKMKGLYNLCVIAMIAVCASCQKEDLPVVLPEKGDAEYGIVEMGEDYANQVFFDFESGRVVHMSLINSWHLAFESSTDGYHVFMNGGADVFVYNTHETDFAKVNDGPSAFSKDWMFDRPCGLNDSTAIGDWRQKNEVYIVKINDTYEPNNLKKIRLVSVTSDAYVFEYADLEESIPHIVTLPKDNNYNYSYFSFSGGGQIVQPDPPKNSWDIVFTRYRFIYYDLDNFPYIVNGVLTNPYNTSAYASDSSSASEAFDGPEVLDLPYKKHRDVIGYGWKKYDFDEERYKIDKTKRYMIHNRENHYWKLNFLDFYNKQNIKGSPSFEYVRMF